MNFSTNLIFDKGDTVCPDFSGIWGQVGNCKGIEQWNDKFGGNRYDESCLLVDQINFSRYHPTIGEDINRVGPDFGKPRFEHNQDGVSNFRCRWLTCRAGDNRLLK